MNAIRITGLTKKYFQPLSVPGRGCPPATKGRSSARVRSRLGFTGRNVGLRTGAPQPDICRAAPGGGAVMKPDARRWMTGDVGRV